MRSGLLIELLATVVPAFDISACVLCGGTDYVRAPFTRTSIGQHGDQAVFICKTCGMTPFFSTNAKNEHRRFAEDDYYESGAYTVYHPSLLARVDTCIADLAEKGRLKGKRLLDIGCGEGHLLERAREAGADVTGLEPNKSVCRKLAERGFRVVQGFGEDYPLGEQFDVITLFWVLDATRNPISVLRRMRELLAPDGILVIQLGSVYNMPLVIQRPMESVIRTPRSAPDYHPFYFTRRSLKACLTSVGFQVVEEPKKYSTMNYFIAERAEPRALTRDDMESWRSVYRFFAAWGLRDFVLVNGATKSVYRRLNLETWKGRIKTWLSA